LLQTQLKLTENAGGESEAANRNVTNKSGVVTESGVVRGIKPSEGQDVVQVLTQYFNSIDLDKSGELDLTELNKSAIDEQKIKLVRDVDEDVKVSELRMTNSNLQAVMGSRDSDGSNGLNLKEFLGGLPAVDNGFFGTRTRACVVETTRPETTSCVRAYEMKECNWKWWKGRYCWSKNTSAWFQCTKSISTFAVSTFEDCWNQLREEVTRGRPSAFADLVPMYCSNISACKTALLGQGAKMVSATANAAGPLMGYSDSTPRFAFLPGMDLVRRGITNMGPEMHSAIDPTRVAGGTLKSFINGSATSAHKIAQDKINLCAPNNMGLFYFVPTDCGAFEHLKALFGLDVLAVPGKFINASAALTKCITKETLLKLPTPFLEPKADPYCLPTFLKTPIQEIMGSFKYFVSQMNAVKNGCAQAGKEASVCEMALNMITVGNRLKAVLDAKIPVALAAARAARGDAAPVAAVAVFDCSDKQDWKLFVEAGLGIQVLGVPMGTSIQTSMGCFNKTSFLDLALGIEFEAGVLLKESINMGEPWFTVGFETKPFADYVNPFTQFAMHAKWEGNLNVLTAAGVPIKEGGKVALQIPWPDLAAPIGFKVTNSMSISLVQDDIDEAVALEDSPERKVSAALTMATSKLAKMDVNAGMRASGRSVEKDLRIGVAAMRDAGGHSRSHGTGVNIAGGVSVRLCLTCPNSGLARIEAFDGLPLDPSIPLSTGDVGDMQKLWKFRVGA
jgi:hypothetical protein